MGKKNLPSLERRNYFFEVRADHDSTRGAIIAGRPVVYSQETDIGGMFSEVIEPGALDGADLSDVRFLVNHDMSKIPIARSRQGSSTSTMTLTPVSEGLDMESEVDIENNSDARALYSAVGRGDVSGMSFMFSVAEERWEDENTDYPKRHILKIGSIVEVSAVTFPAYTDTEINARGGPLESARAALESARKKAKRSITPEGVDELALAKAKILDIYKI